MRFVAVDVETANEDLGSICQIGLATFVDGKLDSEWKTYVDPEDDFSPINVSIHGINEQTVRGAPTFAAIIEQLHHHLDGAIAAHHTFFDRAAILNAAASYEVRPPGCKWLDTARVARRTWPEVRKSGYGLGPLCDKIGYRYQAHDALEDAKAAAHVLLEAVRASGTTVDEWLFRAYSSPASHGSKIARDGDPTGPLSGEVVVFTGALSLPRADAADLAARLGCRVGQGVTKATTLLVVGGQDIDKLAGHEKSSKQRKAEQLAAAGQPIRFLSETQFAALSGILEDGQVSLSERREARAAVAAVSPGVVPIGLGIAGRVPRSADTGAGGLVLRLVVPEHGRAPERRTAPDLPSVQFLRNASGSSPEETHRALCTFAAVLQQDVDSSCQRIEEAAEPNPIAADMFDELEDQVAAFARVAETIESFSKRSSLDASQKWKLHALSGAVIRAKFQELRDLLATIDDAVPKDARGRAEELGRLIDSALLSLPV